MKLLMKWAQFINNYQKSTPGGPLMKQFVLQSCFFMYYRGILMLWQTKGLIFLMNVLPDVYICSHRKKSTPLLREGTVKCTEQPRKFTEYANWNKWKWHYSQNKDLSRKWYCQTLKAFRIISSKMKISLLILSWWCFSCLHIQRIGIQYTDQLFWKIIA